MTDLLSQIKSRGWWQVVIRPTHFEPRRVAELSELLPVLQRSAVGLRGWDFPHIDPRERVRNGSDWVGQTIDWEHYLELWRFYQSGQFVHLSGIHSDWRDRSRLWPGPDGWKPGTLLPVVDTLYRLTEIVEFAGRLAMTAAGDDRMFMEIHVHGLLGRMLYDEWGHPRSTRRSTGSPHPFPVSVQPRSTTGLSSSGGRASSPCESRGISSSSSAGRRRTAC